MFEQPQNLFTNVVLNLMRNQAHTIVKRYSFTTPFFWIQTPISFALFIPFFLGSSSIGQVFNLWPPPNKTSPFHWTLDLRPLFQMPLSFLFIGMIRIDFYVGRV
jgi:hypothetical protein